MWKQDLMQMLSQWGDQHLIQRIEATAFGEILIVDTSGEKWHYKNGYFEKLGNWKKGAHNA